MLLSINDMKGKSLEKQLYFRRVQWFCLISVKKINFHFSIYKKKAEE